MKRIVIICVPVILLSVVLTIVSIGKSEAPLTSVPKEPPTPTEEFNSPPPFVEEVDSSSGIIVKTTYISISKDPDAFEKALPWIRGEAPPPSPNLLDSLPLKETDTSTSPTD